MANRICVLDEHEQHQLIRGEKPSCRNHRHVSRREAISLVSGTRHRPWLKTEYYNPEARWASMQDGTTSKKHIVMLQGYTWAKRSSGGYATMQLIKQAKDRR